MNEQIAKIAKQAGLTLSVDQQVAFQRAAELIVRECASMTRNLSAHGELAEKAVKEHFGVEE